MIYNRNGRWEELVPVYRHGNTCCVLVFEGHVFTEASSTISALRTYSKKMYDACARTFSLKPETNSKNRSTSHLNVNICRRIHSCNTEFIICWTSLLLQRAVSQPTPLGSLRYCWWDGARIHSFCGRLLAGRGYLSSLLASHPLTRWCWFSGRWWIIA